MRISDWSSDVCSSDLGRACSAVLERSAAPRPIIRRTRARPRGPMRDPRHAPAESCMRRCLPILALALLLARPALAQEQPVDAQDNDPPVAATGQGDNPEAAESAASKVPLEEIKRYVAVFTAIKEAYVEPVDDKAL